MTLKIILSIIRLSWGGIGKGEKCIIILAIISIVILHSFIALYIDRLNHIKGNSNTNWGLIPFANVYLLGELVFNKLVGVIMFIGSILSIDYHITLLGTRYGFDLIPNSLRITLFIIVLAITIILLIFAAIEYGKTVGNNKYVGNDLIFYIKETLWILVLIIAIYVLFFIIKKYSV